ncbi:hypothetical protein [Flavobacterium sp.]|uniref:hypothetical protein n=1 Tax=Flavobacterium sp. TaxID=239 RepID=UPI0025BBF7D7|nr:hypothetical protein [Flavobacterium sp.]MBA4155568.1 hypothetical protein [Flavobacterium sp.]
MSTYKTYRFRLEVIGSPYSKQKYKTFYFSPNGSKIPISLKRYKNAHKNGFKIQRIFQNTQLEEFNIPFQIN